MKSNFFFVVKQFEVTSSAASCSAVVVIDKAVAVTGFVRITSCFYTMSLTLTITVYYSICFLSNIPVVWRFAFQDLLQLPHNIWWQFNKLTECCTSNFAKQASCDLTLSAENCVIIKLTFLQAPTWVSYF